MKLKDVESNIVRCPDRKTAEKMIRLIEKMRREGNTVGGIVEGVARGVPAGWGEPVFDKLEADLAKAMLSLPASKAFEVGSGFGGILLTGREHNDAVPLAEQEKFSRPRTVPAASRAASRTARRFSSASRSSPSPRSCTSRTRWTCILKTRH